MTQRAERAPKGECADSCRLVGTQSMAAEGDGHQAVPAAAFPPLDEAWLQDLLLTAVNYTLFAPHQPGHAGDRYGTSVGSWAAG